MSEIGDRIKEQAPLSFFPDAILSVKKLSAPTAAQVQYILAYNAAAAASNWTECRAILNDHPELERCRVSTTDYNTIIDEIKAIELYYQEEMEAHFDALEAEVARRAQIAIGINDGAASDSTSYSSNKIEDMVNSLDDKMNHISHVSLPLVGWKDANGATIRPLAEDEENPFTAPYTQIVAVAGMGADSYPLWYYDGEPTADQYETFCYVSSMETGANELVTFTCASDLPIADINIMIKGL